MLPATLNSQNPFAGGLEAAARRGDAPLAWRVRVPEWDKPKEREQMSVNRGLEEEEPVFTLRQSERWRQTSSSVSIAPMMQETSEIKINEIT